MMNIFRYSYIPKEGIKALDEYKYNGGEYSWLDLRLNPFWFWCAEQLPLTIAPNLITLIGTSFLLSIALGLLIFDPYLEGNAPSYVYIWFAISVWIYQTLDAVDGKQARRTQSSSPLGQLFDHGCDALGTMPLALAICSCMAFGPSKWTVILAATIQIPFYMAQYEEHFAHSMRTQVANFGVTEGQYLEASLMLITAVLGKSFWDTQVPYTEIFGNGVIPGPNGQEKLPLLTLRTCALYAGCFFPCLLGLASLYKVFRQPGKEFAFLRLIPVLTLEAAMYWMSLLPSDSNGFSKLFKTYPIPFMVTFGILLTHLTNRIIIATVCKIPYPFFEFPILSPLIILLLTDEAFKKNRIVQLYFLSGYAILVTFLYLHFAVNVGHQIAGHLKINILSLKKKNVS